VKHVMPAIRNYLFITVLTGLIYPLMMTAFAQGLFPWRANGSLVVKDGKVVGSRLIEQKFENPKYFWGRPSAVDFNPLPSGGSNLGPTSADLLKAAGERAKKFGQEGLSGVPQDLLFASGSGLDPEFSLEAALFQLPRVAQARGVSEEKLRSIVAAHVVGRDLGFLGEPRINVLELNLDLDDAR